MLEWRGLEWSGVEVEWRWSGCGVEVEVEVEVEWSGRGVEQSGLDWSGLETAGDAPSGVEGSCGGGGCCAG